MPVVAVVDGVRIMFYANEHPPPHFHAFLGEHRLRIEIVEGSVMGERGPGAMERKLLAWVEENRDEAPGGVADRPCRPDTKEDRLMRHRVESAVAVDDRRLRIRWTDGLEGLADFSELVESRGVFEALRDPERFRDVRIEDDGYTIYWLGEDGYELDICPDVLRAKVDPKVAAWIADMERKWAGRSAAE